MRESDRLFLQSNLLAFTEYIFEVRKKQEFLSNWHHEVICDALEKVLLGDIQRLIINLPPRYSKTELAVVNFIAWALGLYPDSEFIHVSYSKRLATNNAYNVRALVQSPEYQDVFDNSFALMHDSQAKDEFKTDKGGVVYATGAEGTITGYGAGKVRPGFGGCIIIDDPHKANEALSDVMRENVIEWYKNTLESRKNTKDTPIIVIMQRLHELDLAGWLLDGGNGEKWEHICIPAINDDVALWDEKHTIEDLKRMEKADEYTFAGQYMQSPSPIGGGILKKKWWRIWPDDKKLPVCDHVFASWDTAYSEKDFENSSSSAMTLWGVFWHEQDQRYALILLSGWDGKVDYPDLRDKAKQIQKDKEPDCQLIEKKASGQSLIQDLRRSGVHVRTYNPDRDKISRAYAVSAMLQSGQIYAPDKQWASRIIDMVAKFPNGAAPSSDYTDTCTQAWLYLRNGWWVTHPDDEDFDDVSEEKTERIAAYG